MKIIKQIDWFDIEHKNRKAMDFHPILFFKIKSLISNFVTSFNTDKNQQKICIYSMFFVYNPFRLPLSATSKDIV